jgi:hypothetical protein
MNEVTQAKLLRALGLATVVIALVHLLGLSLPALLVNLSVYRPAAVETAAFAMLGAVLAGIGLFLWIERPFGRWRWFLLAVLSVAGLALTGIPPTFLTTSAEWSFGVVCWAGLLLLLDYGFSAVVAFLAGHFAFRLGLLAAVGGLDRESVAGALIFTAGFLAYQISIAFAATLLRRMAIVVARAVRDEGELRTAEAIAEQLHRDREERYAGLDAVPLLTELAAGVLDPADERVRVRCVVEAARMRRLFAESDDVPDPLVHELRACVDDAERRGLTVYFGTCGPRLGPPPPVRRALTEPVLILLASAASEARITVLGSPAMVTVSVVTDGRPPPEIPAPDTITVTRLTHGGRHWVEATWRAQT